MAQQDQDYLATHKIEDEEELNRLWTAYRINRSQTVREQLILHYAPIVKHVVGRMGLRPDGAIEWADLYNYGIIGLMDAIERYEPERGVTFSSFAGLRIRGAVLDALRQMDPLGRVARRRVKEAKEAIRTLTFQLGRRPTDEEVAAEINLTEEQYLQVLRDASFVMLSLDRPAGGDRDMARLGELLEDPDAQGTLDQVEEAELQERLVQAVKALPKREQVLLSLYYYEDLTMREVASVMNISQTRVCQIHARAVMNLKAIIAPPVARQNEPDGGSEGRPTRSGNATAEPQSTDGSRDRRRAISQIDGARLGRRQSRATRARWNQLVDSNR